MTTTEKINQLEAILSANTGKTNKPLSERHINEIKNQLLDLYRTYKKEWDDMGKPWKNKD